jgi:hypothetical protein
MKGIPFYEKAMLELYGMGKEVKVSLYLRNDIIRCLLWRCALSFFLTPGLCELTLDLLQQIYRKNKYKVVEHIVARHEHFQIYGKGRLDDNS